MPRGVYDRSQTVNGYKSKGYWSSLLKKQANFVCESCERTLPANELIARPDNPRKLTTGKVYCFRCDAEQVFGKEVIHFSEITKRYSKTRSWVKQKLLDRPKHQFVPKDNLLKAEVIYQLSEQTEKRIRSAINFGPYILDAIEEGKSIEIIVIGKLPDLEISGKVYERLVTLDGSFIVRKRRPPWPGK